MPFLDNPETSCKVCGEPLPCSCWDVCCCGDYRSEHGQITGRSLYTFECHGFEIDEDATILALSLPGPDDLN